MEPHGLEKHWGVEHDGIDAGELLEDLEEDRDDERRAARPSHQFSVGVLHQLGALTGVDDLGELRVDVVDAADLLERSEAAVGPAALDEAGGCLGDDEGAEKEDGGGDSGEAEGEAPAPGVDAGGEVVDEVGDEDSDGDVELEEDVERSADFHRGYLRQEERNRLRDEEFRFNA